MMDARAVADQSVSLAGVAARSFLNTVLLFILVGFVLAGVSYYFLRELHWFVRALAVAVAISESMLAGLALGARRGIALAVAHAFGSLRLGRALVRLVFERVLGIATDQPPGARGRIAEMIERVPLASAERSLREGIRELTSSAPPSGWLGKKVQTRLLGSINAYTLDRFRDDEAKHGGIDLRKVQAELENTIDDTLVRRFRDGTRLWTLGVIIGLPLLVAAQTWVLLMVLAAHR